MVDGLRADNTRASAVRADRVDSCQLDVESCRSESGEDVDPCQSESGEVE